MQAYQWPHDPDFSDAPPFIRDAITAREIRINDDYALVYTPTDNVTAKPGDYVIQDDEGNLHVASAVLFYALTGYAPPPADPHNAQVEGADAPVQQQASEPVATPPYSSGVLARSANARAAQATYDQEQGRLNLRQSESD